MASAEAEDPVGQIHEHFDSVFHDKDAEQEMKQMEELVRTLGDGDVFAGFSPEEVARAIGKGKRGKSVGPDGVPMELLQALAQDPSSLQAIV